MNCREWEEAIALLVDGEPAGPGLAEHLEGCDACSRLLQDLRADQEALRTAPSVDTAACELLRQDVLQRVEGRSRWYAAAVAVAAAVLIVTILIRIPARRVAPVAKKQEPAIETPAPKRVVTAATRKSPKKRLYRAVPVELAIDSEWGRLIIASPQIDQRPAQRGSTSEIAMRIQTTDPDVVILLLKEEVKGGSNE